MTLCEPVEPDVADVVPPVSLVPLTVVVGGETVPPVTVTVVVVPVVPVVVGVVVTATVPSVLPSVPLETVTVVVCGAGASDAETGAVELVVVGCTVSEVELVGPVIVAVVEEPLCTDTVVLASDCDDELLDDDDVDDVSEPEPVAVVVAVVVVVVDGSVEVEKNW